VNATRGLRIPMARSATRSRVVLIFFLACAGPAAGYSQTVPEGVVQSPPVVVTDTNLPSDAAGTTRVILDPEMGASPGDWGSLGQAVANFHAAEGGAGGYGSLFALRGLANTPYFSAPAVTVYFADLPLPSSFTYPVGLFGFDSAAVYRGPQGTQFGRATDGGVVVFSPMEAATEGGEILAGAGSYDSRQVAMSARSSSSGRADVEVAADYDARNGYIQNQELAIRVGDQENESAFARLRLRPGAGDEITLELLQTRSRDGAQPLVPLGGPLFEVSRAEEGVTDLDSTGAALKGTFTLSGSATLSTVTSFTDWRMNPYRSFLVLPPPLENEVIQDQKSWNEEIRLRTDPLANLRFDVGAWLSRGTTDSFVNRAIPDLFPVEVSGFEEADRSAALFAEALFAASPALQLTAGLRAEADSKDFERQEEVPTPGLDYQGTGRYEALLPRLAATWTASADSHGEIAVAMGLRPGGFASFTDNPALTSFAPERSTAYSVGWDTAFALRSVNLAVRGFYDAISNLQIERSFSATDYFVATAPRAHSTGAEIEGRWRPSPDWTVSVSAGWTLVRLDRFIDPISGRDESGNEAPDAPRYTANLEATYRPGKGWFAAGQLSSVGKTRYDELGTARYTQGAYYLAGIRVGYTSVRWAITLYGDNLANTGYYELIVPGVNSGEPGAPRTVGVRVAVRF
jgi:iron complex outermembrane receptor protein